MWAALIITAVGALLAIMGALILWSPDKYYPGLQSALGLYNLWSQPSRGRRPAGSRLEIRAVGAVFAAAGLGTLTIAIHGLLRHTPTVVSPTPVVSENHAFNLLTFIIAIGLTASGGVALMKPRFVLEWLARSGGQEVRHEVPAFVIWYVRLAGIVALLAAASAFYWSGIMRNS